MKLYLIDKQDDAIQLAQLLKLNSECAKLHWSRSIKNIPNEVINSLEVIENYVETKIYDSCNSKNVFGELSDDEEALMFDAFKKTPELRDSLGTGVVLADNANKVKELIKGKVIPCIIEKALSTGKSVVLF